jgi:hypothetical protein
MADVGEFVPYEPKRQPTAASDDFSDEKKSLDDVKNIEGGSQSIDHGSGDEILDLKGDDNDPLYASLPQIVREICSFEDDVNMPVLTWRFYVISAVFVALGA